MVTLVAAEVGTNSNVNSRISMDKLQLKDGVGHFLQHFAVGETMK